MSATWKRALATVEYSTDGKTWAAAAQSGGRGQHRLPVHQIDVAGNTSAASTLEPTLDTQVDSTAWHRPPTAAAVRPNAISPNDLGRAPVSATWKPVATVEYSTDGKTWRSSFSPVEGANTVYVHQIDVAGNTSAASTLSFTLDTQVAHRAWH